MHRKVKKSKRVMEAMLKVVKRKIGDNTGASITFALLLFLVCSMVSIVVVVAGSAAAGRMSQRAETDQRYYAVSSAAELLCDDFKGTKVEVEYTKQASANSVLKTNISVTKVNGSPPNESNGVIAAVSKCLVFKIANPPTGSSTTTDPDDILKLESTEKPAVNCTINEYVKKDGRVIFEIFNGEVGDNIPKYTLQTVFEANITQSTTQYTENEVSMEKITVNLEWSVNSIKKGAGSV